MATPPGSLAIDSAVPVTGVSNATGVRRRDLSHVSPPYLATLRCPLSHGIGLMEAAAARAQHNRHRHLQGISSNANPLDERHVESFSSSLERRAVMCATVVPCIVPVQPAASATRELVALLGVHKLIGKGFGNPYGFDNTYFRILLEKSWAYSVQSTRKLLDKLWFLSMMEHGLLKDAADLEIPIQTDKDEGINRIIDSGIWMTGRELVECLGNIAQRGTAKFLQVSKVQMVSLPLLSLPCCGCGLLLLRHRCSNGPFLHHRWLPNNRSNLRWSPNAAARLPPPPPPNPLSSKLQETLLRIQDRVRIFFAVLFWMSLFFWGSAWDGRNDGKKK